MSNWTDWLFWAFVAEHLLIGALVAYVVLQAYWDSKRKPIERKTQDWYYYGRDLEERLSQLENAVLAATQHASEINASLRTELIRVLKRQHDSQPSDAQRARETDERLKKIEAAVSLLVEGEGARSTKLDSALAMARDRDEQRKAAELELRKSVEAVRRAEPDGYSERVVHFGTDRQPAAPPVY